jgi:hypothetical protein
MKVTMPEMSTALWYFGTIDGIRIHRNSVVDIMEAREKDRTL